MPDVGKFRNEIVSLDKKQHEKLLSKIIQDHITPAKNQRDQNALRFEMIDRDYHGHTQLSVDDKARVVARQSGGPEKPIQSKIPFAGAHINRIAESLLLIFKDNLGLYQATSNKNRVDLAKALTEELNKQADMFGHVTALNNFLIQLMKYDFGGIIVSWEEDSLPEASLSNTGDIEFSEESKNRGNCLKTVDVYNLLLDPSVKPKDISKMGEFFGFIELYSQYQLKLMDEEGYIILPNTEIMPNPGDRWYHHPPEIENSLSGTNTTTARRPWYSQSNNLNPDAIHYNELTTLYIWLNSKDWNLGQNDKFELYKICILNGDHIVQIDKASFKHKMLPIVICQPLAEEEDTNNRSLFEILFPLQALANFGLNTYIASHRNALLDLVFLDKRLAGTDSLDPEKRIHLCDMSKTENQRLRDAVVVFQHAPLENSMQAVENANQLMELIVPSGGLQDLANLDRATSFQAEAVYKQAGIATNKLAIIIQDQALRCLIAQMYFNTISNLTVLDAVDAQGSPIEIPITDIVEHKVRFDLGNGLKTLDKTRVDRFWITMLDRIIQSQQALTELDVVAILDHVSNLAGDGQDVSAFRKITPLTQMSPEDQQLAFQLLEREKARQAEEQLPEDEAPQVDPASNVTALPQGV